MKPTNIIIALFLISIPLFVFTSCKEDKLELYDNGNNVYFSLQKWNISSKGSGDDCILKFDYNGAERYYRWPNVIAATDEIVKTLHFKPVAITKDTLYIPVSLMGQPTDYNREIGWQLTSSTTAVENADFKVLDAYIPANATMGAIVIEFYRGGLSGAVKNIGLELTPNQHFQTSYKTIKRSRTDNSLTSMLNLDIYITDDIVQPPAWDDYWTKYLFGPFSAKKLQVIITCSGTDPLTFYPDNPENIPSLNEVSAISAAFKTYLDQQAFAGTPVYEDDGSLMVYSSI